MNPEPRFFAADDDSKACLQALSAMLCRDGRCLCVEPESGRVLDLIGDAVVVVDARRRIVHFNVRALELTGYSPDDVLGRLCTEGLRCVNCSSGCSLFGEGEICNRQIEITTREGARIMVLKDAKVLRDAAGRVVGGIETLHDVTDLQRTQQETSTRIQARCRLLEAFTDQIEEGIVALDAEGRIACASGRAAEILGLDPEGLHDLPFAPLLTDPAHFTRKLAFVLGTGGRAEMDDAVLSQPLPRFGSLSIRMSRLTLEADDPPGAALVLRRVASPSSDDAYFGLVGRSPATRALVRAISPLAAHDVSVLIQGESGTGKEVVARALHLAGPRAGHPFHAVNCAGLAEELVESDLFGHERGAFTGAVREKPGRMELCGSGTLLLDEIGCLSLRIQAKLLRVLETREFERVGGTRPRPMQARIVAATNSDLQEMVRAGTFRADLYYRLHVVPIVVSPLRERREDVLPLARHFARGFHRSGTPADEVRFSAAAIVAMEAFSWPGNVRELRNAVQYALVMGDGRSVELADLPPDVRKAHVAAPEDGAERARLEQVLIDCRYDRQEAARRLGVSRTTLWRRMRQLGLG